MNVSIPLSHLLSDVCQDVETEVRLRPLRVETFALKSATTDDDARLDIKAHGLWEWKFSKTYFDVKSSKPLAKTCPESSSEAYKYHLLIEQISTKSNGV